MPIALDTRRFRARAPPLQVAVVRLLRQLSDVYSSLRIEEAGRLVPFYGFTEVEAVIVDAVKHDYLQVGGGGGGVVCVCLESSMPQCETLGMGYKRRDA